MSLSQVEVFFWANGRSGPFTRLFERRASAPNAVSLVRDVVGRRTVYQSWSLRDSEHVGNDGFSAQGVSVPVYSYCEILKTTGGAGKLTALG